MRRDHPDLPKDTEQLTPEDYFANTEIVESEYSWLQHIKYVLDNTNIEDVTAASNSSWAAFFASQEPNTSICPSIRTMLPLFTENSKSVAMIMHAMRLIKQSINFLNPGQIPVVALDQPLYAVVKKEQWTWPNEFGKDHFVVVLGGLHIEMAFMSMIGDVLEGSGWVDALIKSGLGSPGLVESFLSSSHLKRTRYAHKITACALYSLLRQAYQESDCDSSFDDFCDEQVKRHPQFRYWLIIMRLEVILLSFVRSLQQGNFELYIESLKKLAPLMFALDHINYALWLPIHLRDMLLLKHKHPEICAVFQDGGFVVQPSNTRFSAISMDQAHKMNNKVIKGDGGIIGLTENKSALER